VGHGQSEDSEKTSEIPRPQRRLRPDPSDDNYTPRGSVSQSRFALVFGAASTVAVVAVVSFFSVGMVLGASLGPGIGGFIAEFDNITYTQGEAEIYPVIGTEPSCEKAPQVEADLAGKTLLDGMVMFYKDLPLPDSSYSNDQIARISIVASSGSQPTEVNDLNLRLTSLSANKIELGDTELREFGPGDYETAASDNDSFAPPGNGSLDPSDPALNVPEFGINASTFVLPSGGIAAAHQISFGDIDLNEVNLYVSIKDKSKLTRPVERVVEPNNRTCSALASAR
jgi:hypothetical protein